MNKLTCIKIVELKQRRYNGGARNEAYLHLSDDVDYVWYVDSDDWLKDKYVLEKINNVLLYQPDVVFVGMDTFKGFVETQVCAPKYKNRYDALLGWSGSCGKVIKKKLATRPDCLYNEGTLKEDKNQHCRICIHMKSFVCIEESLYVWNRTNTKSVTTKKDDPFWITSTIRHYADTMQLYLECRGLDAKIDKILKDRVDLCEQEVIDKGVRQF